MEITCGDEIVIGSSWMIQNEGGDILVSGIIETLTFTIDLSQFAGSLYYFIVSTNENNYVEKIIKL
ncbi:MAG: hypothetical protein IPG07_03080 [Crocinitomicaceae bacterium]|nr:hypothetical protein [Crocinitomicaceae bacterium]